MAFNQNYGSKGSWNGGGFGKKEREDLTSAPSPVVFKFYDNDGNISEKLFEDTASNISKTFIGKDSYGKATNVSPTQLRKFFDEVKSYEKYFVSDDETKWEEKKPYIKMLKSKIAYAVARKGVTKGVYKNLEKFISDCVNYVNREKDYFVFLSLFEAVYGFYCEELLNQGFKLNA